MKEVTAIALQEQGKAGAQAPADVPAFELGGTLKPEDLDLEAYRGKATGEYYKDPEVIRRLILMYAWFFLRRLRAQGFRPDFGDIQGELGIAYTEALIYWTPEAKQQGDVKTCFTTYMVHCFNSAIHRYIQALIEESSLQAAINRASEGEGEADPIPDPEAQVSDQEAFEELLNRFEGVERIIAKELVEPSDKVVEALKAHVSKAGRRIKKDRITGMKQAISESYNIPLETVNYSIRKIRDKLRDA